MGARELRARLWLAACACALAREAGASLSAQCAPDMYRYCTAVNPHLFIVNDRYQITMYKEGNSFGTACTGATLDEFVWPVFPEPAVFKTGFLSHCSPPQAYVSYATALKARNITFTEEFKLLFLEHDYHFNADSLYGTPPKLELHGNNQVLVLPPGVLGALGQVRSLYTTLVRAQELPPHLHHLEMEETGVTGVTDMTEFLKNVSGTVKIKETNLTHFEQTAPNLQILTLIAPNLRTFSLYDTPLAVLQNGSLAGCRHLMFMKLRSLRGSEIAQGMLFGLKELRQFELTQSNITTIPRDLFSSSPGLRIVNLTDNNLRQLPWNLFTDLTELTDLWLTNNRLIDINVALPPLHNLVISGNSVVDLCIDRFNSQIRCLTFRYLNDTTSNETLVCPEWLQNITTLRHIDLAYTDIRVLNSTILRQRPGSQIPPSITVQPDLIEHYNCSKYLIKPNTDDFHVMPLPPQLCDCGTYWLTRMIALGADTKSKRRYPDSCAEKWSVCT